MNTTTSDDDWAVVPTSVTLAAPPPQASEAGSGFGWLEQGACDAWNHVRKEDSELSAWLGDFYFKLEALTNGVTPAMTRLAEIIGDDVYALAEKVPVAATQNPDMHTPARLVADELASAYAEALRNEHYDTARLAEAGRAFFALCADADPDLASRTERAVDHADDLLAAFHAEENR
jgi:hypothetical protein